MHEIFEEDNRKAYKEDMNRFGLLREYVGQVQPENQEGKGLKMCIKAVRAGLSVVHGLNSLNELSVYSAC